MHAKVVETYLQNQKKSLYNIFLFQFYQAFDFQFSFSARYY